ncbi:MAG: hypothetical protein CYPHOPRED_000915 [Cyphobasidiales sp. Tagirdzhanova-0007]|nr:MAG: hypothetical protein CYPHOPRED_000915 [Cyphobasidiales sp. Tagirdzhanova-0007]
MKIAALTSLAIALVAVTLSTASPICKRQYASTSTTTQVLQYALTLEDLESTFYKQGLALLSAENFTAAEHENAHVSLPTGALGNDMVAACTYDFGVTSAEAFVTLATVIENLGVSAYIGASQYIADPGYSTIAAAMLSIEARHQAYQSTVGLL